LFKKKDLPLHIALQGLLLFHYSMNMQPAWHQPGLLLWSVLVLLFSVCGWCVCVCVCVVVVAVVMVALALALALAYAMAS
jgi:hypothetical protein